MKKWSVLILSIVVLSVSGISVYSAEKPKMDAKALFEQKCSICHSTNRAKSKKKTAIGWKSTVLRMKNVRGCSITDEEAKNIINYLSKNYGR